MIVIWVREIHKNFCSRNVEGKIFESTHFRFAQLFPSELPSSCHTSRYCTNRYACHASIIAVLDMQVCVSREVKWRALLQNAHFVQRPVNKYRFPVYIPAWDHPPR